MTPQEFASIKQKIEQAKSSRDRAEGAKQKIEESWASEFEVNNLEEAESKIADYDTEINADKAKLDKYYSQLEKVTSWDE